MPNQIEEGTQLSLDFKKIASIVVAGNEVIPVVVQDIDSREILIVAYANQQALTESLRTKIATFWSTSRNELWIKGATSGDKLLVHEIRVNCEQNSLLYLVKSQTGFACHTRDSNGKHRKSCYYRKIGPQNRLEFIET